MDEAAPQRPAAAGRVLLLGDEQDAVAPGHRVGVADAVGRHEGAGFGAGSRDVEPALVGGGGQHESAPGHGGPGTPAVLVDAGAGVEAGGELLDPASTSARRRTATRPPSAGRPSAHQTVPSASTATPENRRPAAATSAACTGEVHAPWESTDPP